MVTDISFTDCLLFEEVCSLVQNFSLEIEKKKVNKILFLCLSV